MFLSLFIELAGKPPYWDHCNCYQNVYESCNCCCCVCKMDIWLCILQADLDGEAIWSRYERQPPPCRCSQAARTTPSLLVTSLCWPCHLFGGVPDAAGTQVSQPQGFKLEPVVAYLNGCSDFFLFTFEHRWTCFQRPLNDCLTQGCNFSKKLWQFHSRVL